MRSRSTSAIQVATTVMFGILFEELPVAGELGVALLRPAAHIELAALVVLGLDSARADP